MKRYGGGRGLSVLGRRTSGRKAAVGLRALIPVDRRLQYHSSGSFVVPVDAQAQDECCGGVREGRSRTLIVLVYHADFARQYAPFADVVMYARFLERLVCLGVCFFHPRIRM